MKFLRIFAALVAFALVTPAFAVDLSVTAANVSPGTSAKKQVATASATITAGQTIYKDATTGKVAPSDVDSGTAALRTPVGVAINGAGVNQPVQYVYDGDVNVGATLVVGTIYVASDTLGGIKPAADLNSGDYVTVLGVATTSSNLKMKMNVSGAAVP